MNYWKRINEGIIEIKKSIISEVQKSRIDIICNEESDIYKITKEISEKTKRKIVLIIDEWDLILRKNKDDKVSHNIYFVFLTSLINDNIALTYLTGILPIKRYGLNSDLAGIFTEYSMTSPGYMAKYVGFTDDEVKALCEKSKLEEKRKEDKSISEGKKEDNDKRVFEEKKEIDDKRVSEEKKDDNDKKFIF